MLRSTLSALAITAMVAPAFADNHGGGDMSEDTTGNGSEMNMTADAQDDTMSSDSGEMNMTADASDGMSDMSGVDLIRTRDITGGTIYSTDPANDEFSWNEGETVAYDNGWNNIGSIEDIDLTKSGEMTGVVAEIGGFLDIADKHVMLDVNDVQLVAVDDASYALVTSLSEEELEQRESIDEGFWN